MHGQLRQLIAEGHIECDAQPDGVIKLAHLSRIASLARDADLFNSHFEFPLQGLDGDALHRGDEVRGGIRLTVGCRS